MQIKAKEISKIDKTKINSEMRNNRRNHINRPSHNNSSINYFSGNKC